MARPFVCLATLKSTKIRGSMKHIVACVPFARDFIYRDFFKSWTQMLFYAKGRYDLSVVTSYGPYIDVNRDCMVIDAMQMEPDKILFLDDDQTYPPETPEILLNHDKMIVGGVTPIKDNARPMLWNWTDESFTTIDIWPSLNGKSGLTMVDGLGMGGVMVDPKVFDMLDAPYFKIDRDPNKYKDHGEDISFYKKCKQASIEVWVDLDLQYGHLFMQEIRIGDCVR